MSQRLPPLPWLRAFEASARHLSFTGAAAELHLTQAAISKQVRLLEHFLREPLFQRLPRSLVLTTIGAAYLPKVNDAFQRLTAGTEEVFGNRKSEVLTLRAAVGFSVNWLASRLPDFFTQHQNVGLRIVSSVWNEGLTKERFDLDIRYGKGKWPGFQSDRLTWEYLEPVCAPVVAEQLERPDDLATQRLLHVMGYEEGWADWLKSAGVGSINAGQGLQFDTSILAFAFAAQGGGVALGRSSMSTAELTAGRLVRPFDLRLPTREAFYLVAPDDGSDHPDAGLLRDWLVAQAMLGRDPAHPDA